MSDEAHVWAMAYAAALRGQNSGCQEYPAEEAAAAVAAWRKWKHEDDAKDTRPPDDFGDDS